MHTLTFTAGFLTRPCCVIPAAVSVLGLSGAGMAAAIAPWRPWLIALALVLFAISFHRNFIRNRSRPGMMVWGVSVVIAAALLAGPIRPTAAETASETTIEEPAMNSATIEIPVEGMACAACASRLQSVLNKAEGVHRASVSYEEKRARVECDADADREAITEAVRRAGFTPGATVVTE